jgi:hypothetical protein
VVERLSEETPTLVGIDHGFSFPVQYFEKYGLSHDWTAFLRDFQHHSHSAMPLRVQYLRRPGGSMTDEKQTKSKFADGRRRHSYFQVTVFYADGERFARVYTDEAKATKFAERQKKSPMVKAAKVVEVNVGRFVA